MKIILTARVSGLGQVGDIVEVKNGYAKNFLIPNEKAICLTANNQKIFEAKKAEYEKANQEILKKAEEAKAKLIAQNIVIIENASDDGRLYGSVNNVLIAAKINEFLKENIVDKNDISLENPIKEIGVHNASIDLHSDVTFSVKLVVSRSESEVDSILKADEKAKKDAAKAAQKEKEELEKKKALAEAKAAAESVESEPKSEESENSEAEKEA